MTFTEKVIGIQSWLHLDTQDSRYTLTTAGLPAAVDCGWVEQMQPFIAAYSQCGDTVLDPFAGWGTTLLAAQLLQRASIGIEIEAARVTAIRQRLAFHAVPTQAEVLHGDSTRMTLADASIDLCLTSIPYFGPWRDADWQHATPGQCYSQTDYTQYLALLDRVFAEVARVLKSGAYFIPMAENLRIAERFVPLAWDCARLLERHFIIGDERIIVYDKPGEGASGLRSNRSHEYALVCRKQP